MAIADDISVATNGDIRYTGSTANYTVIELHRFLGDLMDDAQAAADDLLDITSATSSERATDTFITLNSPFNIDDTLAQHLYDGSIVQDDGDEIYDGIVNYGNAGVYLQVVQNGALVTPNFWTTGLNADAGQNISHRFLVKVRTAGADIDGRRLIGQCREFNNTYAEFTINGTARGNNVLAIADASDTFNQTAEATVATWSAIDNTTEGYVLLDVDNDTTDEPYYSEWNRDTFTIAQFFERMKWLTRRATSSTIYGLNGELFRGITHEIVVDTPTGTFAAFEAVSWTGGTGQMLAINSTTAPTKMWIQLLTGVAPTDGQTITGASTATADVNTTVTARPLSQPFCGASTGSALLGAYGFGMETADLSAADRLIDLDNVTRTPPNNVIYNVIGVVVGEDYILVGPRSGGVLNKAQFTLATTLSGATESQVDVGAAIPTDTPTTGTIRIELNSGIYRKVAYTSYSGQIFQIGSVNFTGDNATSGNDVFISYIDKLAGATTESFNAVYLSDRDLFVRVRDGGGTPIKTFESPGTLGSTGGSTQVNRISDA